jgi:hypothetical protein
MWYTDPRVAIVAQIPLARDVKRAVAAFYRIKCHPAWSIRRTFKRHVPRGQAPRFALAGNYRR